MERKGEKYKGESKKDLDRFIARNTAKALGIESFNEEDYFWFKGKRYKRGNRTKKKFDNGNQRELGDRFFEFWNNSFNFTGKTNRRDYWNTVLQLGCIYLFVLFLALFITLLLDPVNLGGLSEFSINFGWLVAIVTFIPNLAIQVRRLNDIGKEPAWVLLSFVPFISLILIFWYAKPSLKNKSNSNSELEVDNTNQFNNLDKTEERLEKFKVMLEKDLITSEEYEKLKRKLLGL